MLKLFMCLRLELITFKLLSIKSNIFFSNLYANFLASFLLFTISFEFAQFFSFSPTKIVKLRKFETKKHVGWGEGGLIQLFKPKISPN